MPPFVVKRVHKPTDSAANNAVRPVRHRFFVQNRGTAVKKPLADGYCHQKKEHGTMIHNGFFGTAGNTVSLPLPLPPGALAVVTVKSSYLGFAVSDVGFFLLTEAGDGAA
jgi:hypothetical protein